MATNGPRIVNSSEALNILNRCYPYVSSCFEFHQISIDELQSVINKLKPSKYDRNGNIPTFVFKDYFHLLGQPLLTLINFSKREGTFPDFMKVGTLTPLYKKKGDRKLLNNYRPITVLPTEAKIYEKILYSQLNKYFESKNFLNKSRFGFRKNLSTVHAIQKLLESIFQAFEEKIPALSLHFDLAEAFDSIDHEL